MNKKAIIMIIMIISSMILLTGCIRYGRGQSNGYVYAVDDGIIWDKVWFKPKMESSESDCYLIDDDNLKKELRNLPSGTQIKINYNRHLITASYCGENEGTNDEITSFEIIKVN